MTTPRLSLAAAALALACAHAPAGGLAAGGTAAGAPDRAPAPERVLVTGSHIPQRVDPRTGRALTASPVQVYTREDLARAGLAGDTAAALMRLDPSLRP